jgi:hypothetical protein
MADISEVITLFDTASGRASLDANTKLFYINQGARLLDRLASHDHTKSRQIVRLDAGVYRVNMPDRIRAIHHSYACSGSTTRQRMQKEDITYVLALYPDLTATSIRGTPEVWALEYGTTFDVFGGTIDDTDILVDDVDDLVSTQRSDILTIVIAPPPDTALYHLELYSSTYTPPLTKKCRENFWTINFPDALVYASMYTYDTLRRNEAGATAWMLRTKGEVTSYIHDQIEHAISDMPSVMEG